MSQQQKKENTQKAIRGFCKMMDSLGWKYELKEEERLILTGSEGEEMNISLKMVFIEELELITVLSTLPFEVPKDKRLDLAVAVCDVNNRLANGTFDLNISDGTIICRLCNSYAGSELSEEVYKYLLFGACHMVDEYNDKFYMLSKGITDLKGFLEAEEK